MGVEGSIVTGEVRESGEKGNTGNMGVTSGSVVSLTLFFLFLVMEGQQSDPFLCLIHRPDHIRMTVKSLKDTTLFYSKILKHGGHDF